MSPGDRAFLIKRALLRSLADCQGYPVLELPLRESCEVKIDYLQPTTAEIDAAIRAIDIDRLCVAVKTERGRKFDMTDAGRLWLAQNP